MSWNRFAPPRGQLVPSGPENPESRGAHLDLGNIEEAGRAANEGSAREAESGHRLQSALVEASRAVLQHSAPL